MLLQVSRRCNFFSLTWFMVFFSKSEEFKIMIQNFLTRRRLEYVSSQHIVAEIMSINNAHIQKRIHTKTRTHNEQLTSSIVELYEGLDATSEVDVSLVSGVTSSFVSNSLVVSATLRCNHASQSWRGHQETFPGISRLNSWVWKDDDDDDDGPPSAKAPPPPPRAVQLPGSRLTVDVRNESWFTRAPTPRIASHERILPTARHAYF